MISDNVIADSTFYIYFLDDVNEVSLLLKIMEKFKFHIPPKIKEEIMRSTNFYQIENNKNLYLEKLPYDIKQILNPILSSNEKDKGDAEIIFLIFHFLSLGKKFITIIDDDSLHNHIVKKLFPLFYSSDIINGLIKRTLNFLYECAMSYKIIDKKIVIETLQKTKDSKFRIRPDIIDGIITKMGT
ncbi:hypothetical protein M1558_01985 [Candidatus Parvarchaeota archaeon]|jgi:hypothetical protein|nr:hypothetical protein [Candidatus Parvarchaeota archaeon]